MNFVKFWWPLGTQCTNPHPFEPPCNQNRPTVPIRRGVLHCWTFQDNFRGVEEKYGDEMAQKRMLSPYQSKNRTTQPNKEGVKQCNVPYTA